MHALSVAVQRITDQCIGGAGTAIVTTGRTIAVTKFAGIHNTVATKRSNGLTVRIGRIHAT